MSDIEDQTRSSDPLGGRERKMKIMRLITTQKINFRKRKPSTTSTPVIYPMRSASEHRSEVDSIGSREPLGRSLGRGRPIGDEPESNETLPGSNDEPSSPVPTSRESPIGSRGESEILDDSTPADSRSLYPTPVNEINPSDRSSPQVISTRTTQNVTPESASQHTVIESSQKDNDKKCRDSICDRYSCPSFWCFLFAVICLLCTLICVYIWYLLIPFLPASGGCVPPRTTWCGIGNNNDRPRWII